MVPWDTASWPPGGGDGQEAAWPAIQTLHTCGMIMQQCSQSGTASWPPGGGGGMDRRQPGLQSRPCIPVGWLCNRAPSLAPWDTASWPPGGGGGNGQKVAFRPAFQTLHTCGMIMQQCSQSGPMGHGILTSGSWCGEWTEGSLQACNPDPAYLWDD